MNKFILGLSFLGLAISCGKDISNRPQDRVSYIESSVGKPFTLQFLDEKCMLSAATGEVNTKISLFNTIQYQIFDVPKSDVLNLKVLNPSNATNELDIVELFTVAGSYDYKYFYQKKHNKYVLDSRELKGEKSFTLCAGRDYSKEESYQSAAASAYYSFDSIEKQLKPLNLNLPKIKVRIAPKVKQVSDFRHGRRI